MKKVIIFGTGVVGSHAYDEMFQQFKILCFADNDKNKVGSKHFNLPIISAADIPNYNYDFILIAVGCSSTGPSHGHSIYLQLTKDIGIPISKIEIYFPFFAKDNEHLHKICVDKSATIYKNFEEYTKNNNLPVKIIEQKEFVNMLEKRAIQKKSKICHIVCGGQSLIDSYKIIKPSDLVLGMSEVIYLDIPQDSNFAHPNKNTRLKKSREKASMYRQKRGDDIIFWGVVARDYEKYVNNWPRKLNSFCVKAISANMLEVKTIDRLEQVIRESIESDVMYTWLTAPVVHLVLAYKLGIKKVAIHGMLDKGTPYFSNLPSFDNEIVRNSGRHSNADAKNAEFVHFTGGLNFFTIPIFQKIFKEKGMELYAAHETTGVAKLLPVIKVKN